MKLFRHSVMLIRLVVGFIDREMSIIADGQSENLHRKQGLREYKLLKRKNNRHILLSNMKLMALKFMLVEIIKKMTGLPFLLQIKMIFGFIQKIFMEVMLY